MLCPVIIKKCIMGFFMDRKIVLASRNRRKVEELQSILHNTGFTIVPVSEFDGVPDVEETGKTFAENAILKAETVMNITGLMCIADDSGLEVDILNGAPGIYSARFSGECADDEKNNRLLLEKLSGVDDDKRKANFTCVIALASPGSGTKTFEGKCFGRILNEPQGENGFGYDPLFYSVDTESTFAQAPAEIKNKVSHRARALIGLKGYLEGMAEESDV